MKVACLLILTFFVPIVQAENTCEQNLKKYFNQKWNEYSTRNPPDPRFKFTQVKYKKNASGQIEIVLSPPHGGYASSKPLNLKYHQETFMNEYGSIYQDEDQLKFFGCPRPFGEPLGYGHIGMGEDDPERCHSNIKRSLKDEWEKYKKTIGGFRSMTPALYSSIKKLEISGWEDIDGFPVPTFSYPENMTDEQADKIHSFTQEFAIIGRGIYSHPGSLSKLGCRTEYPCSAAAIPLPTVQDLNILISAASEPAKDNKFTLKADMIPNLDDGSVTCRLNLDGKQFKPAWKKVDGLTVAEDQLSATMLYKDIQTDEVVALEHEGKDLCVFSKLNLTDLEISLEVSTNEDEGEDEEGRSRVGEIIYFCQWTLKYDGKKIPVDKAGQMGAEITISDEEEIFNCDEEGLVCDLPQDAESHEVTLNVSMGKESKSETCRVPSVNEDRGRKYQREGRLRPPRLFNYQIAPIMIPGIL